MPNPIAAIGTAIQAVPPTTPDAGAQDNSARRDAERAADYRLVIEEGPRRGSFVYKTINRTTGELIRQYPREALVKMTNDVSYAVGTVADTRV